MTQAEAVPEELLQEALRQLQGSQEEQLQGLKVFCEHRDPRSQPLLRPLHDRLDGAFQAPPAVTSLSDFDNRYQRRQQRLLGVDTGSLENLQERAEQLAERRQQARRDARQAERQQLSTHIVFSEYCGNACGCTIAREHGGKAAWAWLRRARQRDDRVDDELASKTRPTEFAGSGIRAGIRAAERTRGRSRARTRGSWKVMPGSIGTTGSTMVTAEGFALRASIVTRRTPSLGVSSDSRHSTPPR